MTIVGDRRAAAGLISGSLEPASQVGDVEHQGAELGVRRVVVEGVDPALEGPEQLVVVQLPVGDADDAAAEGGTLLPPLPAVLHHAAAVRVAGRVFQGREQDLEGHVAFKTAAEVVEHDHLVGVLGDQLEQAHRGQVPALVGVDLPDLFSRTAGTVCVLAVPGLPKR